MSLGMNMGPFKAIREKRGGGELKELAARRKKTQA